jgi:hypothetical protein
MADLESAGIRVLNMQATNAGDELGKSEACVVSTVVKPDKENEGVKKENIFALGLLEFLDVDDRPVFILDLISLTKSIPVYCNPALRRIPLLELKIGKGVRASNAARDPKMSAFIDWATFSQGESNLLDRLYCDFRWSSKTIRKRWRIISGETVHQEPDFTAERRQLEIPRIGQAKAKIPERPRPREFSVASLPSPGTLESQLAAFRLHRDELIQTFPSVNGRDPSTHRQDNLSDPSPLGRFDITRPSPFMVLSPHIRFVLDFDWESTELGPISSWPTDLRRMVNILMSDPRAAAMFWGKDRTIIYNEPYVLATGQRHPGMMGKKFIEAWSEVEGDFTPMFDKAYETGSSYVWDDARFYFERHGYLEETYYSISIIPFNTEEGGVALLVIISLNC